MAAKMLGYAKKIAGLLLIELVLPGGTLIVLTLLLTGGTLPIPERVAEALPVLKMLRRA
jgi:hypothetical protein